MIDRSTTEFSCVKSSAKNIPFNRKAVAVNDCEQLAVESARALLIDGAGQQKRAERAVRCFADYSTPFRETPGGERHSDALASDTCAIL